MANKKRTRTLAYVRAEFPDSLADTKHLTLEDYLRSTHTVLATGEERTCPLLGKTFVGVRFHDPRIKTPNANGFSFRIATSVEGRNASLLPHDRKKDQVDTPQATPPAETDFMDGDSHVHVQGNHAFYCAYHLRIEGIQSFLRTLFQCASLDKRSQLVKLEHVAANDIVKQVKEEGIGAIGLNASMHKASMYDQKTKRKTEQIFRGIVDPFISFFKDVNDIKDSNKMKGLSTKVEFSIDRRQLKKSNYNPLEIMSGDLVRELSDDNDLDSFYVRTLEGNVIRGSKFMIRKPVALTEDGQTVDCLEAWRELIAFKAELAQHGKITI